MHIGKCISLLILTEVSDQLSDGSSTLGFILLILTSLGCLFLHGNKLVEFILEDLSLGLLVHLRRIKDYLIHFLCVQISELEVVELGKHFLDRFLLSLVVASLGEQLL